MVDSRRSVVQYIMDVMRETRGQFDPATCHQAIKEAVKWIDQKGNWSFKQTERNLSISGPYREGTISGGGGSLAIVGAGTTWDTTWYGRSITFGGRLDYQVATINSPTLITLRDPLAGSGLYSAQPYTLWAGRYLLPDDCEPGRDLVLKGNTSWGCNGEIRKMVRPLHERRKEEWSIGGPTRWYTDGDIDETLNRPTIILWPYPSQDTELRLLYFQSMSIPTNQNSLIVIPMAFERLITLKASTILMGRYQQRGWLEKENEANAMLGDLYNRHAASSAYDTQIETDDWNDPGSLSGDVFQDSTLFLR